MAYAFSIGNARSNQAPTVQRSAKSLKLKKVLRFGQSGCLLERRGGAEAALLTYRQMPRYRRQARREMPSFFRTGASSTLLGEIVGRRPPRRLLRSQSVTSKIPDCTQPCASRFEVRTSPRNKLPERRRVVHPLQVHQLVDHHVVAD